MQKIINKIIKLIIIVSIVFASELIFGINTYAEGSFKQTLHTGTGEFNISAENKDFKASQSISLNISKTYKSGIGGLFQRISSTVNRRNIETIKVEIIKNDKPISTQDKEISSTTNNINLDTKDLTPGSYTLKITDSDGNSIEQDFTWGVLAINTNKSIFSPQEDAKISMAVLNDSGKMVCDAKVKLEIRNPKSESLTLSTDNKTIKVNAECEIKDYTLTPDYESIYKTSEPGTYTMSLTATTNNGTRSITDSFEVRQNPEYDIERITATRLYPVNDYPVILNIKANQDFQGIVQEKVEQNFEVHYLSSEELNKKFGLTENLEKGLVSTLPGSHNENDNILKWQVNWKKGETYTVAYYYNPPDKSPDFFTIGPLELINNQGQTVFQELRVWQLANDDISTGIIVAWPSTAGTIPSGWQRVTALDSTYTREVPNASTDPGSTGGTTTHTHTTSSHNHTISHTHVSATSNQATGSITAGTASHLDLDPTTHTHTTGTISATTDNSGGATPSTSGTTSNDPAYLSVIWITPTTTDTGIPDGALAMFNTTPLPGSWAIYTNSQDRFLKGAVSSGDGGGTGGTATHNHTGEGSHTHTSNHTRPGGTTAISGNQGNSYAAGTVAAG